MTASPPHQALPAPRDTWVRRWACRLYAAYISLRWVVLAASIAAVFVVASALFGTWSGSAAARTAVGLAAGVLLPLIVRGRLRSVAARRFGRRPALGGAWFLAAFNTLVLATLALGFSDVTGRVLRRRGDWFLGEADGWLPRRYRRGLARTSQWLERFDLPPEAQVLADAARPQPAAPSPPLSPAEAAPPGPALVPGADPLPGPPALPPTAPGSAPPPVVTPAIWFHPISGPDRALPPSAACRFGAPRPGPRPAECEMGHCGIDLARPRGTPVYAVYDGVILTAVRDEARGGLAGRHIRIAHKDGAVVSSYVHLDELDPGIKAGERVRGGDPIGTVGATGTVRGGNHLHFSVAVQRRSGLRYIDPEPLLWFWRLPEPTRESPEPQVVAEAAGTPPAGPSPSGPGS